MASISSPVLSAPQKLQAKPTRTSNRDASFQSSFAGLLVTQSDHRIHTHGSARRNVASKKHYSEKQGDHRSEGHRVGGTHAEKKTRQEPRQYESHHQSESHSKQGEPHSLAYH